MLEKILMRKGRQLSIAIHGWDMHISMDILKQLEGMRLEEYRHTVHHDG